MVCSWAEEMHAGLTRISGAAVKENAAEACTTACKEEQIASQALAAGAGGDKDADSARLKEAFDSCYTKCVAQETKDVAEERQKVRCRLVAVLHWKMQAQMT